jgi:NDP-sugar pyrophosphorylase family protein
MMKPVSKMSSNLQAVILAAGRGKRLHPITATRTKAMVPILNKPIIERVMDSLLANGIQSFIVVASPEDNEIKDYFENQTQIDADIIIIDQPDPLGMGHALQQAVPYIKGDFVLSSCDNLVDPTEIKQMLTTWFEETPNAILTTLRVSPEEIVRMGIVEMNGDHVSRIVEKPSLETAPSNIGSVPLYMFSHQIIGYLSEIKPSARGEYELQDAIQMMIDNNGFVRAFPLTDRRDLTTWEDLLAINLHYLSELPVFSSKEIQQVGNNTCFTSPVYLDQDVKIGSNCAIGPNVFLEHGSRIGNNAQLQNTIVLRGRDVPDGSVVRDRVIW